MNIEIEKLIATIEEDSAFIKESKQCSKSETPIGVVNGCYITMTTYSQSEAEVEGIIDLFGEDSYLIGDGERVKSDAERIKKAVETIIFYRDHGSNKGALKLGLVRALEDLTQ